MRNFKSWWYYFDIPMPPNIEEWFTKGGEKDFNLRSSQSNEAFMDGWNMDETYASPHPPKGTPCQYYISRHPLTSSVNCCPCSGKAEPFWWNETDQYNTKQVVALLFWPRLLNQQLNNSFISFISLSLASEKQWTWAYFKISVSCFWSRRKVEVFIVV